MSDRKPRRPAAYKLDEIRLGEDEAPSRSRARTAEPDPLVVPEPDAFAEPSDGAVVPAIEPRRPRPRWPRVFFAAAGGLLTLALGLAVDNLVRSLFDRGDWFGWLGLTLTALALIALLALAIREAIGLLRLRRITHLQELAGEAVAADDRQGARETCREMIALYEHRPESARGRTALEAHMKEIIDGRDLVGLAETELLAKRDAEARAIVLSSAKRVSVVTAISPRALVDVLFVLVEILRLIRRLATLYGGRPGTLGFLRLARRTIGHLAITGGIAAGDSLFQQVLGHGIAARISTRLGEGVINGILTARVGIAAIDVCRPLPFVVARPPRIGDIIGELTRRAEEDSAEPKTPTPG